MLHVVMLEAFAGPRPPGMRAKFLNRNRADTRASNLAWADKCGDMIHAQFCPEDLPEMRAMWDAGYTTIAIARRFNINQPLVSELLAGRSTIRAVYQADEPVAGCSVAPRRYLVPSALLVGRPSP